MGPNESHYFLTFTLYKIAIGGEIKKGRCIGVLAELSYKHLCGESYLTWFIFWVLQLGIFGTLCIGEIKDQGKSFENRFMERGKVFGIFIAGVGISWAAAEGAFMNHDTHETKKRDLHDVQFEYIVSTNLCP